MDGLVESVDCDAAVEADGTAGGVLDCIGGLEEIVD
jgi:hypothetical protein